MTDQERVVIDNYLTTLICTSKTCKSCLLRHDNICFFAYECFPNYSWFTSGKEGEADDKKTDSD